MATLLTKPVRDLSVGDLLLDLDAMLLTGPAASVRLDRGPFAMAKALMRRPGQIVPTGSLIQTAWPDPDLEPANATHAIRVRVTRLREALVDVGVPAQQIRSIRSIGYRMDGVARIVRALTPEQAAAFDAWASMHPAFQQQATP